MKLKIKHKIAKLMQEHVRYCINENCETCWMLLNNGLWINKNFEIKEKEKEAY